MKTKVLIAILCAFVSATSFGQGVSFGVRGGVNFFNINGKDNAGNKLKNDINTGFHIGAVAEIPVGIDFYVQPGVLFSTKGAKNVFNTENDVTLSYIEIPVNFLYKPAIGSGKLIMGLGPYIGFGIGGKYKYANSTTADRDVKYKSNVTAADLASGQYVYFKNPDAGANLLFGYEWANHLSVQLNAGLGLVNIAPEVEGMAMGETNWKNTGFGISVGYRFH